MEESSSFVGKESFGAVKRGLMSSNREKLDLVGTSKVSMSKIYTTYFAYVRKLPQDLNFISIAVKTPPGTPGKKCPELFPDGKMLSGYKDGTVTEEAFTKAYKKKLALLHPDDIVAKYGEDGVYLCWEGRGSFCHRHLVADWFKSYGYEVEELIVT